MSKFITVERFADNGEFSHWELVDENGETVVDNIQETKEEFLRNKLIENIAIEIEGVKYSVTVKSEDIKAKPHIINMLIIEGLVLNKMNFNN